MARSQHHCAPFSFDWMNLAKLKIFHTSDWHLGHQLHGLSRAYEHRCFLDWLQIQIHEQDADALIVSGDIYDHANPSSEAQRLLYNFLAQLHRQRPPHFRTILVGGNHDSAIRLDAPIPLLDAMNVHVVGGLPRSGGNVETERVLVPLHDKTGHISAWCAAVPYLRMADLPSVSGEEDLDPMIEGMRQRYDEIWEAAREKANGLPIIATGHCYMAGGEISELSERRILGGNQHALPADIFPEWLAYVALGHLHKAQRVAGRETLRYSGAPLPLSFGEDRYKHQVMVVHLNGEQTEVDSLAVPRFVEMIRLGPFPLEECEKKLAELDDLPPDMQEEERPFLEVRVSLSRPEPGLRRKVEDVLAGKAPRLLKTTPEYDGSKAALGDSFPQQSLADLKPEDVFEKCYEKKYSSDMSEEMRTAFATLLDTVEDVG